MIHYLDPNRIYTDRSYLKPWLGQDTLVITDNDFQDQGRAVQLISQHPIKHHIYDITHNPCPEDLFQSMQVPLLTHNYQRWYDPKPNHVFFPLFLWSFSSKNSLWWQPLEFDADSHKDQEIMCLNSNARSFRTQLWEEFNRRNVIHKMIYSFRDPGSNLDTPYRYPLQLYEDTTVKTEFAMGVEHNVYNRCAVNLVTETSIDLPFISEKTCKPFMARQIPIIVGNIGINKFLQDTGLDMFGDLIPWHTWDQESVESIRINKIADFVEQWIRSGTILSDYKRMLPRVEKNKQYFHSQRFREIVMCQMYGRQF